MERLNDNLPLRQFLLLPSVPTPNGPLHLGHIAGPYLRMDIARRIARRAGHSVTMIGGFDVFDSYIEHCAERAGILPAELCAQNISAIKADFRSLDIGFDGYVNVLEEHDRSLCTGFVHSLFAELAARGCVVQKQEHLRTDDTGNLLVGSRVTGHCPFCGSRAAGFCCEQCFQHLRPEDYIEDGQRQHRYSEATRQKTCWFQTSTADRNIHNDLLRHGSVERLPDTFREVLVRYLDRRGPELRLTVPSPWGIPIGEPTGASIAYSGFTSLAGMLVADIHFRAMTNSSSAFARDSNVEVICSFGADNLIPRVISGIAMPLALGTVRPPDRLWVNHFYTLEGGKFSTSRNHAIWARPFSEMSDDMPDMLRVFLAHTAPGASSTDFDPARFVDYSNTLFDRHLNSIFSRLAGLSGFSPQACPSSLLKRLLEDMAIQYALLSSDDPPIPCLAGQTLAWAAFFQSVAERNEMYWAAKALAWISSPLTPRFASRLWQALGASGDPSDAAFLNATCVRSGPLRPFPHLSIDCLGRFFPTRLAAMGANR